MGIYPESISVLIDQFSRFPGIGRKTAQRLAFFIMHSDNEFAAQLAQSIVDAKTKVIFCTNCGSITEDDPCRICQDPSRNDKMLCVVEESVDIYMFEKTGLFNGVYHVLGGHLSPLDGIGPEDLNFAQLVNRIRDGMEVILATNPSIEGDTTALYISKLLMGKNVKISRLARGLPVGSALEYIDEATIARALEGRTTL
jgi:recombination protein RecR